MRGKKRQSLFGEALLGALDYWRFRVAWCARPFNGQIARQQLFSLLIAELGPRTIIETGTCEGATTEFMASSNLPIFTIEHIPRLYGYSRARLFRKRNIKVLLGDSRAVLTTLVTGPLLQFQHDTAFFYLDAHWQRDLPLADEVGIIFNNFKKAIVMIDDFCVPFDDGYGYDSYGPGESLTLDYLKLLITEHALSVFFPSTPSCDETGGKRGCAILINDAGHKSKLGAMAMLRSS